MIRTRSKSNAFVQVTVAPFLQTWVGNGSYTVPAGSTVTMVDDHETMSDDPSVSRRFKTVIHEKYNLVRAQGLDSDHLVAGSNTFDSAGVNCWWHIWGAGGVPFLEHRFVSKYYEKTANQLVRDTMDAFMNPNEVDTLLNIVEAPELITGVQTLFRHFKSIRLVTESAEVLRLRNLGKASAAIADAKHRARIRALLKKNARTDVAILSGGFLYWQFGLAPIISDMKKVSQNLLKYKKQVESVIQKAGQEITVHKSCKGSFGAIVPDGTGSMPQGYGSTPGPGKWWTTSLQALVPPTMTCTIKGIREQKYNTKIFQSLDYLASRFGSTGPASFAYERIPFSFVLDWFVDLSDVKNRIDNALTGDIKKVRDACISYKWKALCPIYKMSPGDSSDSLDGSQIATLELSHYSRHGVQPTFSVDANNKFGKRQGRITAALLGQMAASLSSQSR